jgi:hypothetical protein
MARLSRALQLVVAAASLHAFLIELVAESEFRASAHSHSFVQSMTTFVAKPVSLVQSSEPTIEGEDLSNLILTGRAGIERL